MRSLEEALHFLNHTDGCSVNQPSGIPPVALERQIPSDLLTFYAVAGGASLFKHSDYPFFIASPASLVSINELVVGRSVPDDISHHWFSIAEDGNGDYLSIDLHPNRAGLCYDSFHETHAIVGSTPVIATSFTDLLIRLIGNAGRRPYWLDSQFASLGDAYSSGG